MMALTMVPGMQVKGKTLTTPAAPLATKSTALPMESPASPS